MLISPPFLLPPTPNEPDGPFLDRTMIEAATGSFPVGAKLDWHGGVHLTAPTGSDKKPVPVRAIADGTIAFVRKPSPVVSDPNHPLNYGGGWTDDGCVVVRHVNEIGSNGTTATAVTFFSIYLHLSSVEDVVKPGASIFRKDPIGKAGQIFGAQGQIHFELICDDANVVALTGRKQEFNDTDSNGRTDVVFGNVYYLVKAGTSFFATEPPSPGDASNAKSKKAPAKPTVTYTSDAAMWVRMSMSGVNCVATTLDVVQNTPIGDPVIETGFLTKVVATATAKFPASARAGVELLTFGRVLSGDTLTPAGAPHWRKVATPQGQGWVDLNAGKVRCFSEADFPFWDGPWGVIDGAAAKVLPAHPGSSPGAPDSRVPPDILLQLTSHRLGVSDATTKIADPAVRALLAKKVVKFQTEWEAEAFDRSYGWLTTEKVLNDKDFARFKAYATALAFWKEAALGVGSTPWHFHGRSFIEQFRKCGWLTAAELAQCIRPTHQRLDNKGVLVKETVAGWNTAVTRGKAWAGPLNMAARTYRIASSAQRILHFLSQALEESTYLSQMIETDGDKKSYAPYYGRGLIQLSLPENYGAYGKYRAFPQTIQSPDKFYEIGWDPDVLIAKNNSRFDAPSCADSSAFFWSTHNLLAASDAGISIADVTAISKTVNGGVTGLEMRIGNAVFMKYVLMDFLPAASTEKATIPWNKPAKQLDVSLTPQRPPGSAPPSTKDNPAPATTPAPPPKKKKRKKKK